METVKIKKVGTRRDIGRDFTEYSVLIDSHDLHSLVDLSEIGDLEFQTRLKLAVIDGMEKYKAAKIEKAEK